MHALRVLEYTAILDRLAEVCETDLGCELARELLPTFDPDAVWRRLDLTDEAYRLLSLNSSPAIGRVKDYREAVTIAGKGGTLNGSELYLIAEAMGAMRGLKGFLHGAQSEAPLLWALAEALPDQQRVEGAILSALDSGGDVKDSASIKLGSLRQKKRTLASRITERIQSYTTGKARELLSDPIYTVRDGRYVLPLKAENRGKLKGIVHDASASGQTIYVEPEDIVQMGNQIREAESAEREEVLVILRGLSERLGTVADEVVSGISVTAEIDLQLAKARLAFAMKGTLPVRTEGEGFIELEAARHPLLDPETVVPLSLKLGSESILITGPNTGGKTVAMKCVGLAVLMAQSGLLPPARLMRFAPFTQVWADIGDEQSLQQSLSTFSGHIRNIALALETLKSGALVLLDEVGAGTDPAEGAALARAILVELRERGARVLASTHYGELKAFAFEHEGYTNAAMEFDPKTLRPTYRLLVGSPGASHALKIAERYGIPKAVVERAKESIGEQALDLASMLEKLELSERRARQAQGEADRRLAEFQKLEARAKKELSEAEEIRRTTRARAAQMIDEILREIRLEAADVFETIKKNPQDIDRARKKLNDLQEVGGSFAAEFRDPPRKSKSKVMLGVGAKVKLQGYQQVGTIVSLKDGSAVVQMGVLKMTVPADQLEPTVEREAIKAKRNIGFERAQVATTEVQLIQMRAEEAGEVLERFLDDAVLGGVPSIRIVHGKGEGILRNVTREQLRRHPGIASYRDGEPSEGGAGVTIAVLK
jgi:DNA mismatch repair protein MutS2